MDRLVMGQTAAFQGCHSLRRFRRFSAHDLALDGRVHRDVQDRVGAVRRDLGIGELVEPIPEMGVLRVSAIASAVRRSSSLSCSPPIWATCQTRRMCSRERALSWVVGSWSVMDFSRVGVVGHALAFLDRPASGYPASAALHRHQAPEGRAYGHVLPGQSPQPRSILRQTGSNDQPRIRCT